MVSSLWKYSIEIQVLASFCKHLQQSLVFPKKYICLNSQILEFVGSVENAYQSMFMVQETDLKTIRYALKCNSKHKVTQSLSKVKE